MGHAGADGMNISILVVSPCVYFRAVHSKSTLPRRDDNISLAIKSRPDPQVLAFRDHKQERDTIGLPHDRDKVHQEVQTASPMPSNAESSRR